jgi:hypothetical protein
LENAIRLLEKTNRELKVLVETNEADRELNVTPYYRAKLDKGNERYCLRI